MAEYDTSIARSEIAQLLDEMDAQSRELQRRRVALAEALRLETESINVLNGLQKKLDAALAKVKEHAPKGTDWRSNPLRPELFASSLRPDQGAEN